MQKLCHICPRPIFEPRTQRCFDHWIYFLIGSAKHPSHGAVQLTRGVLSKMNKSRRRKFTKHMRGRYEAILQGSRKPLTEEQSLAEAYAIRKRMEITWQGPKGVPRMARLIRKVERRAVKDARKQNESTI